MKAVITGSNGFIGSCLTRRLVAAGHEVRCLIRPSSSVRGDDANVTRIPIDFSNPSSLDKSGALDDADIVFHVGGVTKALSIDAFRAGNVAPTRALLDAVQRVNPQLKRFVLISSQAAAGPANSERDPMTENTPPAPVEDYGRSKWEAEQLVASYSSNFTIIRPAAVYGPRDVDFFQLFKQLRTGLGIFPGNRDSFVSTIHVDDLVDGILLAAESPNSLHQTYYLTNEVAVSWQTIYQYIGEAWGRNIREINVPFGIIVLAGRLGDVFSKLTGKVSVLNSKKIDLARPRFWICTSEKAATEFGFDPKIPVQAGLKQTLTWYQQANWL